MSRLISRKYDEHGSISLMAVAKGYVMVRRPGATPFVLTQRKWDALSTECTVGQHIERAVPDA